MILRLVAIHLRAKAGARAVLAFNNPYSSVVRDYITDFFASGSTGTCQRLWQGVVKARYYQTLED